jgi:branched-chain amino acid transport system permease protein
MTASRAAGLVVPAVLLLLFPFVVSDEWIRVGVFAGIATIAAIGLNVLTGVARQFSVGHAAFIALGAYITAYFMTEQGWTFVPAAAVGVLASALCGLIVAPLATRLRHMALALVTLGLVFLVQHVIRNVTALSGGGDTRIVPDISLFGTDLGLESTYGPLQLDRLQQYYLFVLAVADVVGIVTTLMMRSRVGRAMGAIGEPSSELLAAHSGVSVRGTTVQAFVFSSALAGLTGALTAPFVQVLALGDFGLALSIEYLAIIVIGGLGLVSGAVYGAIFVTMLPQLVAEAAPVLPFIAQEGQTSGISASDFTVLVYSVLVIALLLYEPRGIAGLVQMVRRRRRKEVIGDAPRMTWISDSQTSSS